MDLGASGEVPMAVTAEVANCYYCVVVVFHYLWKESMDSFYGLTVNFMITNFTMGLACHCWKVGLYCFTASHTMVGP